MTFIHLKSTLILPGDELLWLEGPQLTYDMYTYPHQVRSTALRHQIILKHDLSTIKSGERGSPEDRLGLMGSNRCSLGETLGKPVSQRESFTIKFYERGVRNSNWFLSPGLSLGGI